MAAGDIWGSGIKLGSTATDGQKVFAAVNPVAANNQATLLALDAATGTTIWNAVLGGAGRFCYGTPAVGETMVYIGEVLDGPNQKVYGVNRATGQIVWSNSVDTMNGAAVLLHDGKVYFDTDWNVAGLWCLDALSGTVLWSNRFSAGNWGTSGTSVSPDGGAVYNHGDDGILHAVNAQDGSTLWTAGPYESGQGNNEPMVDNAGNIYCIFPGATNGDPSAVLYKYNASGSNLWSFRFGYETDDGGLALSPDGWTLYATIASTTTNLGLFALDPATGGEKWRMDIGKCGGSPVVAAPGNIVIGVYELAGTMWARAVVDNGASAALLWTISLGPVHGGWLNKSAFMRPAILPNGDVMVQNPSGFIACISVPEPALLLGVAAGLVLLLRKR
jgi:outer membrane protein assembly factor BamB